MGGNSGNLGRLSAMALLGRLHRGQPRPLGTSNQLSSAPPGHGYLPCGIVHGALQLTGIQVIGAPFAVELSNLPRITADHEPSPETEVPPVVFIRGSEQRSDPLLGKQMIIASLPISPDCSNISSCCDSFIGRLYSINIGFLTTVRNL